MLWVNNVKVLLFMMKSCKIWYMPVFVKQTTTYINANLFRVKVTVYCLIHWCKSGIVFHNSNLAWIEMLEVGRPWEWGRKMFVLLWESKMLKRSRNHK